MTITRVRITLLLILAVALFATSGCLFSTPQKPDDTDDTVEFGPYTTPTELVDNFLLAWEHMVLEEYRDEILYNGEEPIVGGADCEQFKFYFLAGGDDYDEPFWGYDLEVEHTDALFSGDPGIDDTPGVESISLHLTQATSWMPVAGLIQNDLAPPGTQFKAFDTNMTIYLESAIPGSDNITAFLVDDTIWFYVVPVDVDGATEYRLWKWLDVSN